MRFESRFATRASPLCRFPFRLHRLLNRQNSVEADWLAQCPPMSSTFYYSLSLFGAFLTRVSTTPTANFCCRISVNYSTLSLESETCNTSPAISSTPFDTRPPDLPPASLMDTDFAISCPLLRRVGLKSSSCPSARIFTLRFLQTPPHGDALALRYPSPPSDWDGTCTRQLPNMHGAQQKKPTRLRVGQNSVYPL